MARFTFRTLDFQGLLAVALDRCALVRDSCFTPNLRRGLPPSIAGVVRAAVLPLILVAPSNGSAQNPTQPAAVFYPRLPCLNHVKTRALRSLYFPGEPRIVACRRRILKQEEHQRILGVMPNFNTVESSADVPSLSKRQKFHLMYKSSVDPFVFVADGFVAGLSQAQNTNPGFGQGAQGYFKRFGAAYLDTADGNLWGNAILPVLFKEDPRYFRLGPGRFTRRFLYSAATTIGAGAITAPGDQTTRMCWETSSPVAFRMLIILLRIAALGRQ